MTSSSSNGGFLVRNQSSFSTLYRLSDLFFIATTWYASFFVTGLPITSETVLLLLAFCAVYQLTSEAFTLYRSWRGSSTIRIVKQVAICWAISCTTTITLDYLFISAISEKSDTVLAWFAFCMLALSLWRFLTRLFLFQIRKKGFNSRQAIVIGATETGEQLAFQIKTHEELGIRFKGIYDDRALSRLPDSTHKDLKGSIADAIEMAKSDDVDYIYLALPMCAEDRIKHILELCSDTTASVYLVPNFFVYNLINSKWHNIGSLQALSVYDTPFSGASEVTKRLEDFLLGLVFTVIAIVPMLIIAILVKLSSKGPVIFKQKRYGLDGKPISVYKFRTMTSLDDGLEVKQAQKNDQRITKVGAFLRKTSLDELPQFINVLQGKMSIVGPRPHAIAHNEQYRKIISGYMLRHKVKPGITGWAQVNGFRGETETVDKMKRRVEHDLDYMHKWSVWLDLRIIAKTAMLMFKDQNAY
ncbi:undecaprenyl-phosphate glucose phosphotransferase [Alteromonas sp. S015]|uniref:undecaprenyl-phosphate glucose phosphotransferase n=1 Tax=Alteromonas sp. S015 TaxID=3117401 RepID=UPI002FE081F7